MLIESQKDHYEPLGHYRPMTWRLGVRVGLTVRFRSSFILTSLDQSVDQCVSEYTAQL